MGGTFGDFVSKRDGHKAVAKQNRSVSENYFVTELKRLKDCLTPGLLKGSKQQLVEKCLKS